MAVCRGRSGVHTFNICVAVAVAVAVAIAKVDFFDFFSSPAVVVPV